MDFAVSGEVKRVKRIYLSGHKTLGNRGCEAIVRSTVSTFRRNGYQGEFLVPSSDIARDRHQWPTAESSGVRFTRAHFPKWSRYWAHLQRLPISALKRELWPFGHPGWLVDEIAGADMVLAVGGDNYSLDYRIPGYLASIDRIALEKQVPVVLWGASVGPFGAEPVFETRIRDHLKEFRAVVVRETASENYIKSLGIGPPIRMADPAFCLEPEESTFCAQGVLRKDQCHGLLGLNISPLIARQAGGIDRLIYECSEFVRRVLESGSVAGVVLVPHVTPLGAGGAEDDQLVLGKIREAVGSPFTSFIMQVPEGQNAAQLKSIIGKCDYFVGARTHSTIAAYSQCIPTVSIGYSVKAVGIANDIFGNADLCVPSTSLSADRLFTAYLKLIDHRDHLRRQLESYRTYAIASADAAAQSVLRAAECVGQ